MSLPRSSTFPRRPSPVPGISRTTTTYSLTPRTTSGTGRISKSDTFAYHTTAAPLPAAFSPPSHTARTSAEQAVRALVEVEESSRPEKSKRFLASRLWLTNCETGDGHTFLTFASAGHQWATAVNGLTFGLSAPLCRVYFVEIMFEQRDDVHPEDEAALTHFLQHDLGFVNEAHSTTGQEFVSWLEFLRECEHKEVAFEKHQGNSYAVYLVTVPRRAGETVAGDELKARAEKRYKLLDVADNVIMLGGRFHNSVWSLFH